MFGLHPDHTKRTRYHIEDSFDLAEEVFRARVLVFAPATWNTHAPYVRQFLAFCNERLVDPFDATPYLLNVYLLQLAQKPVTYSVILATLKALSFMYRFYNSRDFTVDPLVTDVKKFLEKVCVTKSNKKSAFGSEQIRKIWDNIDKTGGIENLSLLDLRTFVISVFQHATFCHFSDIVRVTIDDLLFDVDYFKVHINYSKTDQTGKGQFVYVPRKSSTERSPHMLMCLYIHKIGLGHSTPGTLEYIFPPIV